MSDLPKDEPEGYATQLPDLVVEIVSPSDTASDVYDKTQLYIEAGVRMVLVVWPKRDEVTVTTVDGTSRPFTLSDVIDLLPAVDNALIDVAAIFTQVARGT